jgi:cellulose synthase/poly-beta-1,6-N-acetylglucosamine synthase-like glycosyltransferase
MIALEYIFWILIISIAYSYLGYLIVLWLLSLFISKKSVNKQINLKNAPEVTLFVAAYNEEDIVKDKIANTQTLNYPKDKLKLLWITDGSTDKTNEILANYPEVEILFEEARNGKVGAINRGMKHVKTPIVVFCDANSMLSANAIQEIVSYFADEGVGCVAGAKNIFELKQLNEVSTGERWYWKYENKLKTLESKVNSTVGAAGELFAIRNELFKPIPADTILDDFVISTDIVLNGFKLKYAKKATAFENASASYADEGKRKTRIAAGCMQTLFRYHALLNPFKTGFFSFQYFSHKVLRWIIVPIAIFATPILALFLVYHFQYKNIFYNTLSVLFLFSILLFGISILLPKKKLSILIVIEYLYFMNFSIIRGYFKFIRGKQSVNWDKAKRVK